MKRFYRFYRRWFWRAFFLRLAWETYRQIQRDLERHRQKKAEPDGK